MRVRAQLNGTTLAVKVSGEFDIMAAEEFKETVDVFLDGGRAKFLMIDLGGVTFIDSSGLGAILGRYKKVDQLKGKMVIACPRAQVKKILTVSGIDKIVGIYSDKKSALSQLC